MSKKRVSFTLDEHVIKHLKEISEETMIPQSRIVEQSLKKQIASMKIDHQK